MQNFDEKSANMHMGRLIQMLSHQMKRKNCIVTMIDGDSLTVMQKHILKFILLETLHREIYQKDIEEEFQIPQVYCNRHFTADGKKRIYLPRKC